MDRPDAPTEAAAALALSEREMEVLRAIVETHVETREPVGSKVLTERVDLDVSAATIRSVMGLLHEKGLLHKAHSSAGRIPTDAGYRFYVDCLVQLRAPSAEDKSEIEQRLGDAGGVDAALDEAGRVLAHLARKAAVLRAPPAAQTRLRQIEVVRLRARTLLWVLVSTEGLVQNRLVELDERAVAQLPELDDPLALQRLGNYLTERAAGRTLDELGDALRREQRDAKNELETLVERLRTFGGVALSVPAADGRTLRAWGERHLLDEADPATLPAISALLGALEERGRVLEVLEYAEDAPGVRLFIGRENPDRELMDMTLVTAPYGSGPLVLGSIGVIGPTRMDYGRVVPLVEFTAAAVSRLLGRA